MNKHQAHDLKQMQSLPLEAKIRMTQQRIRQWYDHWDGEVYVSFSGGKDSTVLKHIVDNTPGVYDVPAVFVNTGLEYPEIQKFVKDVKAGRWDCFNPNVEIIRPEMRFDEVIKKYGYPAIGKEVAQQVYEVRKSAEFHGVDCRDTAPYNRKFNPESEYCRKYPNFCMKKWDYLFDADFDISHMCCKVMKKDPAKKYEKETGRKPIIGTLATESRLRYTRWMRFGCNAFEQGRPTSQPLSFWTEQDILHYIKKFYVPYCPVYGEIQVKPPEGTEEGQINVIDFLECYEPEDILETTGCDRTGCIFCIFGSHLEKEPTKFQQQKETHPRQYEYCIGGGEMVDGKWQPNKEGLGLGHVLDYIGVKYD
jgi:3'-phosphoadenosine 5'-phosphosulfate sulfotransferase (PAPS reductase)/FAD synthetase